MISLIKTKLNGLVETHLRRISYNDQTLNKQSGENFSSTKDITSLCLQSVYEAPEVKQLYWLWL